jgi:hypothetical protein
MIRATGETGSAVPVYLEDGDECEGMTPGDLWYPRSQNRDLGHPGFGASGIPGLKIETWGTRLVW